MGLIRRWYKNYEQLRRQPHKLILVKNADSHYSTPFFPKSSHFTIWHYRGAVGGTDNRRHWHFSWSRPCSTGWKGCVSEADVRRAREYCLKALIHKGISCQGECLLIFCVKNSETTVRQAPMIKGNCQFSNHKLPPIRGMTTAEIWLIVKPTAVLCDKSPGSAVFWR